MKSSLLRSLPFAGVFFVACANTEEVSTSGPGALIEGFDVPRFELTKQINPDDGHTSIDWEATDDTVLVRCAMFWQAPAFSRSNENGSPTGQTRTISNFGDCEIAHVDVYSATGVLALSAFDIGNFKANLAQGVRDDLEVKLSVGCWSFSEDDVNGATDLLPIFPSEIGLGEDNGVSVDCAEKVFGHEDFVCEVGLAGGEPITVGWCTSNRRCAPTCETCDDCLAINELLAQSAYNDCDHDADVPTCQLVAKGSCHP